MHWIKHFDFAFLFKLIALTLLFNYFSIGYHGIVSSEGSYYSPFLDQNFNYIQWIRALLMHTSQVLARGMGTNTVISGSQIMEVGNGIEVEIWLPCLGLGIMSFWTAFILTNSGGWIRKLAWWIGGVLCVMFINSWRIALFIVALDRNWAQNSNVDHHDLFNVAAYTMIGILMYSYKEGDENQLLIEKKIQTTI